MKSIAILTVSVLAFFSSLISAGAEEYQYEINYLNADIKQSHDDNLKPIEYPAISFKLKRANSTIEWKDFIVAKYNIKGEPYSIITYSPQEGDKRVTIDYSIGMTDEECRALGLVKVFMWDNKSGMKPISKSCEFISQTQTGTGIVEDYDEGSNVVTLIVPDGRDKTYVAEAVSADDIKGILYSGESKKLPHERVVEYSVDVTTGGLLTMSVVAGAFVQEEYYINNQVGNLCITDATKVINAQIYYNRMEGGEEGSIASYNIISQLNPDKKYTGYAYSSDGKKCDFLIVKKLTDFITKDSRFAVVRRVGGDDIRNALELLSVDDSLGISENINVVLPDGVYQPENPADLAELLSYGDAFYYLIDEENLITDIFVIYKHKQTDFENFSPIGLMTDNIIESSWSTDITNENCIRLVFGTVTDITDSNIKIGVPYTGLEESNTGLKVELSFEIAGDAYAFLYDNDPFVLKEYDKIYYSWLDRYNISYTTDSPGDYTNHVLAMIVGNEVVEIYQIVK